MKIKTMYKAILSLAVCLTTMLVISVTVSAAEYEEIKWMCLLRHIRIIHIKFIYHIMEMWF